MPALPPSDADAELPAELALVVYDSERDYRDQMATREGISYGDSHWRLFDKSRSRGDGTAPYTGRIVGGVPYDASGGTLSWARPQGETRFYLGRLREKTSLEQLASWVDRVGSAFGNHGMDGYIIVADTAGVFCSWQHWVDASVLNTAMDCEAGRAIRGARDSLLETVMEVPAEAFAGQVEPGHAYQVLLPSKADPVVYPLEDVPSADQE
jgi:hypothetical protein